MLVRPSACVGWARRASFDAGAAGTERGVGAVG
jgi:hypothetical protein